MNYWKVTHVLRRQPCPQFLKWHTKFSWLFGSHGNPVTLNLIKYHLDNSRNHPIYHVSVVDSIVQNHTMIGAWSVVYISLLVMNRLNRTESAIFFSLACSLLPKDLTFSFFLTGAGHSLYLPGRSRSQYGRHIYVRPSQGSNPRPPHQTAEALTTELWRLWWWVF